jgi:hypothetical protein
MSGRTSHRGIGDKFGLALSVVLILLLTGRSLYGQAIEEYQFKAAFLYNLAKFVEWPPRAFSGTSDPIVSCVAGDSPLGAALERGSAGNQIGARKMVVRPVGDPHELAGCHILFISSSIRKRWRAFVDSGKGTAILTIGETDNFAIEGGMVNFKREGERIRVEINVAAAEREQLRISSRLLSLQQIVKVQAP